MAGAAYPFRANMIAPPNISEKKILSVEEQLISEGEKASGAMTEGTCRHHVPGFQAPIQKCGLVTGKK
jgi:hypothetical protein